MCSSTWGRGGSSRLREAAARLSVLRAQCGAGLYPVNPAWTNSAGTRGHRAIPARRTLVALHFPSLLLLIPSSPRSRKNGVSTKLYSVHLMF